MPEHMDHPAQDIPLGLVWPEGGWPFEAARDCAASQARAAEAARADRPQLLASKSHAEMTCPPHRGAGPT